MLPLQHHHGLTAVLPTLLPSRDPAPADAQLPLGLAIEPGMRNLFTRAGGNQARQSDINPYILAGSRKRRWLVSHAGETGAPLPRLLADTERLDLTLNRTMPANGDPPDT